MVFIYAWSLLAVRSRGTVVFAFTLWNHARFRPRAAQHCSGPLSRSALGCPCAEQTQISIPAKLPFEKFGRVADPPQRSDSFPQSSSSRRLPGVFSQHQELFGFMAAPGHSGTGRRGCSGTIPRLTWSPCHHPSASAVPCCSCPLPTPCPGARFVKVLYPRFDLPRATLEPRPL